MYLGDIDVDQFYNFIRFICFINLSLLVYLMGSVQFGFCEGGWGFTANGSEYGSQE